MRTRRVGPGRPWRSAVAGATTAVALAVGVAAVGIPPAQVAADGSADVSVQFGEWPSTIAAHQVVFFNADISVTSSGGDSTGWNLTYEVPEGLTVVAIFLDASEGRCVLGQIVTCRAGALSIGTPNFIRIAAAAGDVDLGCVVNTLTVIGNEPDPNLDNNTDTVRTQACDADPMGHIEVIAYVDNNHGGTAGLDDISLGVDGVPVTIGTIVDVAPGAHVVTQSPLTGYRFDGFSGDCAFDGSISVDAGQTVHCAAGYDDLPATIEIEVLATPATSTQFEFTSSSPLLNGLAVTPGSPVTVGQLGAGSYTIVEQPEPGWMLTAIGGGPVPGQCLTIGAGGSIGYSELPLRLATVELHNGDTVHCVFENTQLRTTRTQGFWATHPQLAQVAWFGGTLDNSTVLPGAAATVGTTSVCGRPVGTIGALMGGFWAGVSKTSTGAPRSALDQARVQLAQQLLAAELNIATFGAHPGAGPLRAWQNALCGTNIKAIRAASGEAQAFNSRGDSEPFTPGTAADAQAARRLANVAYWDTIAP